MGYGMIGKREKAKRYAEERKRFLFNKFDLIFRGDNNNHHVIYENGVYSCDCEFFGTHQRCAHTMALEILLKDMISEESIDQLAGNPTTDAPAPVPAPATKKIRK